MQPIFSLNPLDLPNQGSQLRTQILADFALALSRKTQDIIRGAIDTAVGHKNWSPEDVNGRVALLTYPDRREVLRFDGVDLIEFMPLEFNFEGLKISGQRKYRLLTAPGGQPPTT